MLKHLKQKAEINQYMSAVDLRLIKTNTLKDFLNAMNRRFYFNLEILNSLWFL